MTLEATLAAIAGELSVRNLVAIAAPDLDRVRERLALIESRGYGRGQDLQAKLEAFLRGATDD